MRSVRFNFAGLDLIMDKHGTWHLIEVNHHPVGILEADAIALTCGSDSVFEGNGFRCLAQTLVTGAAGEAVGLLLPDCYRFSTDHAHIGESIQLTGSEA